jgi:hypothetical protein
MSSPDVVTTVLTAASAPAGGTIYDLITLDVARREINKPNLDQDYLKLLIARASGAIAQYCNRVFPVETVQDEFLPRRRPSGYRHGYGNIAPLQLSRWPVVALTSVVENGIALVDGTDFRKDVGAGLLFRLDVSGNERLWPRALITVVYSAGFSPIPADVQDAAARMVASRYSARGRADNLRQENIPGVREVQYWIPDTPTGNMSPAVQDILDNYHVSVFGG